MLRGTESTKEKKKKEAKVVSGWFSISVFMHILENQKRGDEKKCTNLQKSFYARSSRLLTRDVVFDSF